MHLVDTFDRGALRADCSWVPLNTRAVSRDLIGLLDLTECELLFYHPSLADLTEEIRTALPAIHTASPGRPSLVAELAIMDDDGNLLPAGEVGEIVVRGSIVMSGYYKDPEQTETTRRAAGWHGTSDVGRMDEDGFVYIVDRLRDMIITGGSNVWPSEIEQTIHAIDGVADVAVIGLPDEQWGEVVTAVVQMKPDAPELDVAEVRALCKEKLGPVKAPKQVFFRELPRSPAGKVLKRALRDEYWSEAGRSV